MALCRPCGKLLPGLSHEIWFLGKICKPEPVDAGAFGVKHSGIQLSALPCSRAVHDYAAEISQTPRAFQDVLATQHFEDYIDAFCLRQVFYCFFIVLLLVVNSVLQAEFFYAG